MNLKLPSVTLIVPVLLAELMLVNCAGPVTRDEENMYLRDDAAARASQRAVERQERRLRRRDGSFDRGFTGNYGP